MKPLKTLEELSLTQYDTAMDLARKKTHKRKGRISAELLQEAANIMVRLSRQDRQPAILPAWLTVLGLAQGTSYDVAQKLYTMSRAEKEDKNKKKNKKKQPAKSRKRTEYNSSSEGEEDEGDEDEGDEDEGDEDDEGETTRARRSCSSRRRNSRVGPRYVCLISALFSLHFNNLQCFTPLMQGLLFSPHKSNTSLFTRTAERPRIEVCTSLSAYTAYTCMTCPVHLHDLSGASA
jgi:hypothetical protein